MPREAATRRARGEAATRDPPSASAPRRATGAGAAAAGACGIWGRGTTLEAAAAVSAGAAAGAGSAGGGAGSAGGGAVVSTSSASPIRQSTPSTGMVSCSRASRRTSTPSSGDSTSTITFSVSTSTSGSPRATLSPRAFSQRLMVPSVISSLSFGSRTSFAMTSPFVRAKGD